MRPWTPGIRRQSPAGDVVGIGIHTGNARAAATSIGKVAAGAGAYVVYGGIHATLYPEEGERTRPGARHRQAVTATCVWARVLEDCARSAPLPLYDGGKVDGSDFEPARWSLIPPGKYMWASVQTVRGCPKHCSFCSVLADRRPAAAAARRRRGRRRDRGAAAARVPLHRARRRQFLSGHARRTWRDGGAPRRQEPR